MVNKKTKEQLEERLGQLEIRTQEINKELRDIEIMPRMSGVRKLRKEMHKNSEEWLCIKMKLAGVEDFDINEPCLECK